ncbi:hypothetical protein OAO17_01890 [Candidatus Pelagibacter sp.]|nr:hypothetical protein [Candidatus Pelagibacter sp.]
MKTVLAALIFLCFMGCTQGTALLGPIYTIGTTGNVLQAGASYGTTYAVKKVTGKTVNENINIFVNTDELKEQLKEDPNEFFRIVKKHVKKSNEIYTVASQ